MPRHRVRAHRFSFVIFIALLSLTVVLRGRSHAGEPHVDVYFVPISGPNEHIAELRQFCRTVLHLETAVLPVFTPNLTAWKAGSTQWSAAALAEQVVEREEERLHDAHIVIIAVTDDDLDSERDG